MGCRACRNQLTAFADLELPSEQAGEIESHLASCSDCRVEYESLRFAGNLVDRLPGADLSPPPWSRIQARVVPAARHTDSLWWDLFSPGSWAPVGTAAVALVFSLGLMFPPSMERLKLSRALEEYARQRRAEETLLETALGRVDERPGSPNPFSLAEAPLINPFLTE